MDSKQWTWILNGILAWKDIDDIIVHHAYPNKLVVEIRGYHVKERVIRFGDIDITSSEKCIKNTSEQIKKIFYEK